MEHAETVAQKNKRRGERNREVHGAEERIRLGVKRAPSGSDSFKCHLRRPRVCCRGCSVELRASANTVYAEPIACAVRACSECRVPTGKRAVCGSWKAEKGADKDSRRGGTWCSFSFQDGILSLQLHHISQVFFVFGCPSLCVFPLFCAVSVWGRGNQFETPSAASVHSGRMGEIQRRKRFGQRKLLGV